MKKQLLLALALCLIVPLSSFKFHNEKSKITKDFKIVNQIFAGIITHNGTSYNCYVETATNIVTAVEILDSNGLIVGPVHSFSNGVYNPTALTISHLIIKETTTSTTFTYTGPVSPPLED